MKLEHQYNRYLKNNPESNLTFERWVIEILSPALYELANQDTSVVWSDQDNEKSNTDDEN